MFVRAGVPFQHAQIGNRPREIWVQPVVEAFVALHVHVIGAIQQMENLDELPIRAEKNVVLLAKTTFFINSNAGVPQ